MSKQKKIYIFIGPPGSGKGSLSVLCVQHLGWKQISAGSLCRREIRCGSELGKQIDFTIKSGKLVPDGLIARMVEGVLQEQMITTARPIILDGFPRTVAQAQELDAVLSKETFAEASLVIVRLCISDDIILKRLLSRLICSNEACQAVYSTMDVSLMPRQAMVCDWCSAVLIKRDDDELIVIRERLKQYHDSEQSLVAYLRRKDYVLHEFSVVQPLNEIFEKFKHAVDV